MINPTRLSCATSGYYLVLEVRTSETVRCRVRAHQKATRTPPTMPPDGQSDKQAAAAAAAAVVSAGRRGSGGALAAASRPRTRSWSGASLKHSA